jgi:type IV pilus assembly protein PilA
MNNLKERKLNNKGFSLVELIIVIAIMAVLVGVLAPQYLKYVERSRNSTDRDNATAIANALQVWASETDTGSGTAYVKGEGIVEVTSSGATVKTEKENTAAVTSALENAGLVDSTGKISVKCTSKTKWVSYDVTVTVTDSGVATTSITFKDSTGAAVDETKNADGDAKE